MDSLSDEELATELRRATLMRYLAENAGEIDALALFDSVIRTCEAEQRSRNRG